MAPTNSNCFVVQPRTTTLTDFVGYSMLIDRAAGITDTASMDDFLLARFDNSTGYISGFRSFFGCPNWNGSNQRYHMSFYQGELIYLAQNNPNPCPPPQSPTPNTQLCRSTCLSARQSLQDIFNNPSFCSEIISQSSTIATNRAVTLSNYQQICTQLPNTNNCLQVISLERNTCGFLVSKDATAYCRDGSGKGALTNDPCCTVFLSKVATGTTSNSNTGSGNGNSGSTNSNNGSGNTNSGSSNTNNGSVGANGGKGDPNNGSVNGNNGSGNNGNNGSGNTINEGTAGAENPATGGNSPTDPPANGIDAGSTTNGTMPGANGSTSAASGISGGSQNSGMGMTATTIAIVVGLLGGLVIIVALYMFIAYRNKRGQKQASGNDAGNSGMAGIRTGGANKSGREDGNQSPENIFAPRQRGPSADPILPNAAASGVGGYSFPTDGARGNGGMSEYLDFDYAPMGEGKLSATGEYWMKDDNELFEDGNKNRESRLAQQDKSRGQSLYSAMRESANYNQSRSNNFASVYSEAVSSGVDRPTTMNSMAYNLTSEYEPEYRPLSYAYPLNESQFADGVDMNQSSLGVEDAGLFKVKVLFQYEKDMEDELSLRPGDIVTVTNLFDDGWASGVIGGQSGAFPLACVVPLGEAEPSIVSDSTRMSVLKRRSSINSNQISFQ
ncbi:hypothetical protein BJ741DRAFT_618061 [Chytriomyces cf. hyalinus JEL632]|nr:hypothetical protein BJ741DRAFT_618061 [Chytriomyces cf. hyalinus JEL632]